MALTNSSSKTRLDGLLARLKSTGHRITPQRLAIIKILIDSREHPSVEQIYERVKAYFPMTSLATIYKTLAVLKEMGEVLEINSSTDGARYDGSNPHPHPHLICIKCGSITDVDMTGLDGLPRKVAQKTGYRIVSHQFDFFGICPQCHENE